MYYKNGQTIVSIPLKDIKEIKHRYEGLAGDIFEINSKTGMVLKIEVAPLNQGKSFHNALMNAWNANK